jgi:hypothetical protein
MKAVFLCCLACSLPVCAQVSVTTDRMAIAIDGKPFTTFYAGPEANKPYLYPLRTASGKIVTRGYPMENIAGESKDHPHHRGLWFSHGDVNGYDFWSNEASQDNGKKGKIVLKRIDKVESAERSATVNSTFDWDDPKGKPLLVEMRKMAFYGDAAVRVVDFDITLKALDKATFGDTKEGTFAIRLAAALEEPMPKSLPSPKRTGKMVSAEGLEGEKNVWGKRSPWVDYFGEIDGEKVGVAILDHPTNPRHPTYWHSRSYGLFAANIFGEHDFYNDKSRNGKMTINPGEALVFRYRVIIHPGDYQTARIPELYKKYSEE